MQNFIKTIINGVQKWTKKEIKKSTADWNQNDASAADYVKNRTHWEEEKVIVAERVVSGFSLMQEPIYAVVNPFRMNPVVGRTYTVVWDGVSYDVKMQDFDGLGYIGNVNYVNMTSGGNIPFAIVFADEIFLVTESPAASHTISISEAVVHKLDSKYLDLPDNLATTDDVQEAVDVANNKMDKNNPVGTGSFSMNRKSDTTVGGYSHAEGMDTTASGDYSHAEGYRTTASGGYSHAEGMDTTAASGYSHAEGYNSKANGSSAHAEGYYSTATGASAHAEGRYTYALGDASHAEGMQTYASGDYQHVQGKYNVEDTASKYAHIVGNGTSNPARSNAHTLDWNGVGWFQGGLQVGGNAQDDGAKTVLLEGDAVPVPETAEVGQIMRVKSVDENGKPVEWETTDISTSGGSGCIVSDTAPEDTSVLWIDTSDNSSDENLGGGNVGEMEQLNMLIESDMLPAVHDANGAILTDENGKIILKY